MKEKQNSRNAIEKTDGMQLPSTITHPAVSDYRWCPRKYYLGRILGLEPEFVLPAVLLENSLCHAIGVYNEQRLTGEIAPLDRLLDAFDEVWETDAARVRLTLPVTLEELRERGHDMLRAFYSNPMHAGAVVAANLAFKLGFCPHMSPVSGAVDLVEMDKQGRLVITEYMVVDTLRDRPLDRLVMCIAGAKSLGLTGTEEVRLRQCQITTTQEPVVSAREYLPPNSPVGGTWLRLGQAMARISQGEFEPTEDLWKCGDCDLWKTCLKLGRTTAAPANEEPVTGRIEQQSAAEAVKYDPRAP